MTKSSAGPVLFYLHDCASFKLSTTGPPAQVCTRKASTACMCICEASTACMCICEAWITLPDMYICEAWITLPDMYICEASITLPDMMHLGCTLPLKRSEMPALRHCCPVYTHAHDVTAGTWHRIPSTPTPTYLPALLREWLDSKQTSSHYLIRVRV